LGGAGVLPIAAQREKKLREKGLGEVKGGGKAKTGEHAGGRGELGWGRWLDVSEISRTCQN